MSKKFKFSKEELTNAFINWNTDSFKDPEKFIDVTKDTIKECSKDQAECLISYLEKK